MDNIIEEKIKTLIIEIGDVYKENDWLVVKKYVLKYLNPEYRKFFSKRNEKNKKHSLNNFEIDLINYYYKNFNVRLELDENKKL